MFGMSRRKKLHKQRFCAFMLVFPGSFLDVYKFFGKKNTPKLQPELAAYRVRSFVGRITKKGFKLKAVILFLNLISVIRFKLKCKYPFVLFDKMLKLIEPFFEFKSIRKRNSINKVVTVASIKKRTFFASNFLIESAKENHKGKKKTFINKLFLEVHSYLRYGESSSPVQKFRLHNNLIHQDRFKNLIEGSKGVKVILQNQSLKRVLRQRR